VRNHLLIINTDIQFLWQLSVCKYLRVLDLSRNPVCTADKTRNVFYVLFTNLKTLNNLPYKEFFFRQPLEYSNTSNQIRMLDRVIDSFELALVNEHTDDLDELISAQDRMYSMCRSHTEAKISNLGKYVPPVTTFLSTTEYASVAEDEILLMDCQESNVNWLELTSHRNLDELKGFLEKYPYSRSSCIFPLLETWKEVGLNL
jgi:hypothetical protein